MKKNKIFVACDTNNISKVKEIIKKGISVMSYFIGDSDYDRSRNMDDFKTMYGKDAEFVDVTKVSSLAKTMNNLFLEKGK